MTTGATARPSDAVAAADWATAHQRVVDTLRDLIRIPSVNPPPTPGADGETRVAIFMENTGQVAIATVRTPGGKVVEARDGLRAGEVVVVAGSHVLKSEVLRGKLGEHAD